MATKYRHLGMKSKRKETTKQAQNPNIQGVRERWGREGGSDIYIYIERERERGGGTIYDGNR